MKLIARQIVFLVVAVAVVAPVLLQLHSPSPASAETRHFFEVVDSLPAGSIILVSFDFEASSFAEVRPLADALVRHAFQRNVRVLALSLFAEGTALGAQLLQDAGAENGKLYGIDYAFLGFRPQFRSAILALADSIAREFPLDYYGTQAADLPLLQSTHSYADLALVVSIADGSMPTYWVEHAVSPFQIRFLTMLTATMATSFYPYLSSGQIVAMASGLKGAAEYETLLHSPAAGARGLLAQSVVQVVIVLIIIAGNVADRVRKRGDSERKG
jgi:hypothetical protein